MRKTVFTLITALFFCTSIDAQKKLTEILDFKKTSFGIKSGANLSKVALNGKIAGVLESNYRRGFVAGAFVTIPIFKMPLSVQHEFLYSSMGADVLSELNEKQNLRFNYFSMPVLLKYQITKKLTAFAGPQLDAIIYGREDNKYGTFNITKAVNEFDISATWGMEWWLNKHLVVGGRYMHGNNKIYPIGNVSTYNRGFQLTLGLRFHKAPPLPPPPPPPAPEKDSDGDGLLDSKDKCPTVAGVAKYGGCPVPDTDKDGINDDTDKCPEMAGVAEYEGCPFPDRDKDGVTDNKDLCPDVAGSTKNDGCPIVDRDNDGTLDAKDRCPDEYGPASNEGCPEPKVDVITKKVDAIAKSIYFESNSAKLQVSSFGPLSELAQMLNDNTSYNLSIEGHTDKTGSNKLNMSLSNKRVSSVKDYLVNKGITASRITAIGYGEEQPIADNSTSEGRALNRRVILKFSN